MLTLMIGVNGPLLVTVEKRLRLLHFDISFLCVNN